MKSRTLKNIIVIIAMFSFFLVYRIYLSEYHKFVDFFYYLLITFIAILLFNLLIRKIAWFKPYFVSNYNFLSTKVKLQKEFDIPKEILFDKFIEVINSAGFEIEDTNKDKGEILAITSMSWNSHGHNIYLTLKESKDITVVDFCLVGAFAIYDWGKNERYLNKILHEFENSLTI